MLECKKCGKTREDFPHDHYQSMRVYYHRYFDQNFDVCSVKITLCPRCYADLVGVRIVERP